MTLPLLTAHDATGHVHLVVGSNPLASTRCAKSIESGAKPVLIAPTNANLHYSLLKKIEDGQVEWLKKDFLDEDIRSLGRNEVENVVDAVFVTLGGKSPLSMLCDRDARRFAHRPLQAPTYPHYAGDFVSQ